MNNRLGEVRKNNFGTDMKIIRYGTCEDIDVQFLDGNYYVFQHTTYPNFKNGCIKNPYDKSGGGSVMNHLILDTLEMENIKQE